MSYYDWKPYVPVAERRKQAAVKLAKMQKKDAKVSPVVIQGRTIASSFWGKSWCANLERYSDYANRLPRGRTYVRNGSVLDLQIAEGQIKAKVSGSELYTISIEIEPVPAARWTAITKACAGTIDSVIELLQGRLDKSVMDRVCRQGDGLFPSPKEIKLSCSCPDWADMCKHVAATMYGIGARLDQRPELLFTLRCVDPHDMIAAASTNLTAPAPGLANDKVLAGDDMAALFGLDMATEAAPVSAPAKTPKHQQSNRTTRRQVDADASAKRGSAIPVRSKMASSSADTQSDRRLASAGSAPPKRPPGRQHRDRNGIEPRTPQTTRTTAKTKPRAGKAPTKVRSRLEELIEVATVDAHTTSEQATAFYTMISERLALPFTTKLVGRDVDVVAIEMGDDDRLSAVYKVGRTRRRINLVDLAMPAKRLAGAEWVRAYRLWWRANGTG